MKCYLKYVNPVLSIIVLLLCLWAACFEEKADSLVFKMPIWGGFQTYFVAKGIFCSGALFLLGKLLEKMLEK